jgi:hypothetical protein
MGAYQVKRLLRRKPEYVAAHCLEARTLAPGQPRVEFQRRSADINQRDTRFASHHAVCVDNSCQHSIIGGARDQHAIESTGSCEIFQGVEQKIIIRSNRTY